MTLKTPTFWYRDLAGKPPALERVLTPLSAVYKFFYALDQASRSPYKSKVPVICIGNITAGGTGKTPTALALLKTLKDFQIAQNPFFLIRGYGGAERGPLRVDLKQHTAWDVGDEALILARHASTIIGGDRAASARMAESLGADCIIMDDGLQNPGIHKDIKLVVVNGEMGFGNKKMFPAGPLRQPLEEGLKNATGFIFIGHDEYSLKAMLPAGKTVVQTAIVPEDHYVVDTQSPYIAFAGLGYPQKFFKFLKQNLGMNIVETTAFSDHHPYEEVDILRLQRKAESLDAKLITTEKDLLRVPHIQGVSIETVPIKFIWDNEDALVELLRSVPKLKA